MITLIRSSIAGLISDFNASIYFSGLAVILWLVFAFCNFLRFVRVSVCLCCLVSARFFFAVGGLFLLLDFERFAVVTVCGLRVRVRFGGRFRFFCRQVFGLCLGSSCGLYSVIFVYPLSVEGSGIGINYCVPLSLLLCVGLVFHVFILSVLLWSYIGSLGVLGQ